VEEAADWRFELYLRDVNHTVFNKTDAPMVHVLFEILPVDVSGPLGTAALRDFRPA
jgi:hypothetical protein